MSLLAQFVRPFEANPSTVSAHRLHVSLTVSPEEVRAAQRLRYRVFVEEMGAHLYTEEPGIESDRYDPFCQHLIVRDLDSDEVVACYRILTDKQAWCAGGYYSQSEFDLTRILALPGRLMEVGRACVHPNYRTGAIIALLWQGLARYLMLNSFDYLMGCASIPLRSGTHDAALIYERLSKTHLSPEPWRVFPKVPLPRSELGATPQAAIVPPLFEAYLHAGALVCGEPAWDPRFNVADLLILLPTANLETRYASHPLNRRAA